MNVRYRITLTTDEHEQLRIFVQGGKGAFRKLKRAQILLAAAGGSSDVDIAANVGVGTATVYRTKRRFVEEGLIDVNYFYRSTTTRITGRRQVGSSRLRVVSLL